VRLLVNHLKPEHDIALLDLDAILRKEIVEDRLDHGARLVLEQN